MRIFLLSMPALALAAIINLSSEALVERSCEVGPPTAYLKLIKAWEHKNLQTIQAQNPS